MKGNVVLIVLGLGGLLMMGCQPGPRPVSALLQEYPQSLTLTLDNPLRVDRVDETVTLEVATLWKHDPDFNPKAFVATLDGLEIPSQAVDLDTDGQADQVVLLVHAPAGARQQVTLHYHPTAVLTRSYPKRTQAELSHKFGGHWVDHKYEGGHFENVQFLRCPPDHADHSYYIRYEGPGWESDKVGYRLYLDERNAVDVFGKKTSDMVLQDVGLDGFDSYYQMSDWGADILQVGDSLGVGSIGIWTGDRVQRVSQTKGLVAKIVANGPVCSRVQVIYIGWQVAGKSYDLISDLSIGAGSRITTEELRIQGECENLCTGIGKLGATLLQPAPSRGDWAYLATYGVQSMFQDKLGLAVLYRKSDLLQVTEDALNYVVVLKPHDQRLTYHFLAAWEKEPNGIKSQEEFVTYLNGIVDRLNQPLQAQF